MVRIGMVLILVFKWSEKVKMIVCIAWSYVRYFLYVLKFLKPSFLCPWNLISLYLFMAFSYIIYFHTSFVLNNLLQTQNQ